MQDNRRVYKTGSFPSKWLTYLLLFLSATVLLGGLLQNKDDIGLSITPALTPTPIPTGEAFDETRESRDIALAGHEWYALQLGVFDGEASAKELAERFRARGAAGYIWNDGRCRVLAALYASKDDAQGVRKQLSEQHSVDTYLFTINLPEMALRLSGMKGQLDIIEAAFAQANGITESLQALSIAMDKQETGAEDAIAALRAIATQADTVKLRLMQRFPEPHHKTVDGLIGCFEDYRAFADNLKSGANLVELTVDIKHQAFRGLQLLKEVYDGLQSP